jgi:hypothetical protein
VISSNFNGTRIRRENLNPSGGQENAFPLLTTQTEYTPWIINYKGKEKNYVASGSEEIFVSYPLAITCPKGLYFLLALV